MDSASLCGCGAAVHTTHGVWPDAGRPGRRSAGFAKILYRQQLNFTAVLPPLQAGDDTGDGVRKTHRCLHLTNKPDAAVQRQES